MKSYDFTLHLNLYLNKQICPFVYKSDIALTVCERLSVNVHGSQSTKITLKIFYLAKQFQLC